jgi:hypothetical protein
MRDTMINAHLIAGAEVIPKKGFSSHFVVAKKSVVLATCFGDAETFSAASSIRDQF